MSENGKNGRASAAAYMDAEGTMWLATGEVHRDYEHPMGKVLDLLEETVPVLERYDWLAKRREEFGGKSAFRLIDEENLEPL